MKSPIENKRLDLLDICLDLHGDLTGSAPDTYAEWNQGAAKRDEHLAYLHKRLDEWKPATRWGAFDNAVKAVVTATLAEREVMQSELDESVTDRIKAIEARLAAATPGPWEVADPGGRIPAWTPVDADRDLIANAPADLRYLLDEVRRLQGPTKNPAVVLNRIMDFVESGEQEESEAKRLREALVFVEQTLTFDPNHFGEDGLLTFVRQALEYRGAE